MIHLHRLPNHFRGEIPELFLRRHWVAVLEIAFFGIFGTLVPIIFYLTLEFVMDIDIFNNPFFAPFSAVLISVYFMLLFVMVITRFTDYFLDTWIVTSERIINIEQKGLFSRIISELHLNQVQDVTSEVHGLFATFIDYGDVYIQTAGTRERFNFKGVDNPEEVKQQILKLVDIDKKRHGDRSTIGVQEYP